jgi:hypothetical protein
MHPDVIASHSAQPYHLFMAHLSRNLRIAISTLVSVAVMFQTGAAQQDRPSGSGAPVRMHLQPRFIPGQVMRYHITLESESSTKQSGSIKDPQGPAKLDVTWDATIRLEISAVQKRPAAAQSSAAAAGGVTRIRITYESSQATVRSDTVEPQAGNIQKQYSQLSGRSLEFTLDRNGQVSDVHGLEDFLADDKARQAAEQWIVQISAASAMPAGGVVPGQKWKSTQVAQLPIDGLSWRTDSTYLRNEPCTLAVGTTPAASAPIPPASGSPTCAVILSQLALVTAKSLRDPTPETYRRNNLRTSGRWTGTGQSLVYISLDTGWVFSSTQESTQEMDITITDASADPAGAARNVGSVTTRSQVSSVIDDQPAQSPR